MKIYDLVLGFFMVFSRLVSPSFGYIRCLCQQLCLKPRQVLERPGWFYMLFWIHQMHFVSPSFRLVQLCGSFEVKRNAFSYHTIAALLVLFFSKIFQVLLSVHDYLGPILDSYWADGTVVQCGNEAELRWYRSCLNNVQAGFWCWNLWMPHSKDLSAPLLV